MYYLIQSNIHSDPQYNKVFEVMEELNLDFETIELNDSIDKVKLKSDRKDVFIIGSVKLARLTKANKDWTPGSFYGGNHTFEVHSKYYKEHLLNYETSIFEFAEDFDWKPNERKFIKPYKYAKVFTGRVFTQIEWRKFVEDSIEHPKTKLLHQDTLIQAAPPKKITKEARIWIVGKHAIAGVYYKDNGNVSFIKEVEKEGLDFAKSMVEVFNVADAFVMDIGLTPDGWKIIEINCVNSAGFYSLKVRTLFRALEAYF